MNRETITAEDFKNIQADLVDDYRSIIQPKKSTYKNLNYILSKIKQRVNKFHMRKQVTV